MSEPCIFVFSGPSGVGKNAIIKKVLEHTNDLSFIPSYSTRNMRVNQGEKEGYPYYFVTHEHFMAMWQKGDFLEAEEIHGKWYATHYDSYKDKLKEGRNIIKDIDVSGALKFKTRFGPQAVLIYIEPPSEEELLNRLKTRGDDSEDIKVRLTRLEFELSKRELFDHIVVNDDIEVAVCETIEIIRNASKSVEFK